MSDSPQQATGRNDPNVHVPRGVREAAERAQAAQEAAIRAARGEQPGESQGDQGNADQRPQEEEQPGQQEPQQDRAPPPAPPEQQQGQDAQPPQPRQDEWQHRYNSDKGRWDVERRQLTDRLQSMERIVAAMQQAQAQAAPPAPTEDSFRAPPDSQLSEEMRRAYGDDLVDFVRKIATGIAYEVAGKVRDEVRQVGEKVGTVQTTVQQTAEQRFIADLSATVPDWQTLNKDPGFLEWLDQVDIYSGVTRYGMLNDAYQAKNATRAAAFFEAYKRDTGIASPQPAQPAAQPAPQAPARGQVPLEQFAAPGRVKSGSGSNGSQPGKPTITAAQYAQFTTDITRGRYRGRESEMEARKREFESAIAEGRIR